MNVSEYIIQSALGQKNIDEKKIDKIKRRAALEYKSKIPQNINLLQAYHKLIATNKFKKSPILEQLLKTRKVRTLSGIAAITVITKPYTCPGKCLYCPTEKNMPKSYLANEPACMRAVLTKFDPYRQVDARLKSLKMTGHVTEKIELIVLGGTWSAYPKNYQNWFIKRCFDACNGIMSKSLKSAQKRNETTKNRVIGLTLETRPDFVTPEEIKHMRELGCTRVELGVQSIYDDVLRKNKRGHDIKTVIKATKLLKDAGFKITYHMMPNLPGSNIKKDEKMFEELFSNPPTSTRRRGEAGDFQPDQLKIYPCAVLKTALLYKLWKQGKYKPYSEKQLIDLLIKIKEKIPPYVRIVRMIRDIPAQSIIAGNKVSNLREVIARKMEKTHKKCRCIRCREVKNQESRIRNQELVRRDYDASEGKEIFLSFEDTKNDKILAFLRLRITNSWTLPEIKNCAIIRELHTYGQTLALSQKTKNAQQHKSLGRKLMEEAEKIVKTETPYKKMAVIAGIGVREYYKKLGYKLKGTYMIKNL
ncbi:MAG: tRNA uridine(34) 5-carboxymethylaminomethyl modification radical SAM/GNAT enzyme Elp3 [bacterium]|nr:tRNA uridine(34) 5-carboxymethylaminomethyl modification radical SAM/GNAT enzyme Elp3 [bacterium]